TLTNLALNKLKLTITYTAPLPVQLASFAGSVINQQGHIRLDWRTLTETNNYGFFVQKSLGGQIENYQAISDLIPGHGTTLEPHNYDWTDVNAASGNWYYRLKQVDLDGSENYSEGILPSGATGVKEKSLPTEFGLNQNYPNPFNPTTVIEYALPRQSNVKIEVYNLIGQRMATLVDAVRPAGVHAVSFDANGLSSGLYFYRMTADGTVNLMKKMVLMK
ncbi:MAG: T9SS type A sorting domain-containing protein, partial [bacterium]